MSGQQLPLLAVWRASKYNLAELDKVIDLLQRSRELISSSEDYMLLSFASPSQGRLTFGIARLKETDVFEEILLGPIESVEHITLDCQKIGSKNGKLTIIE